MSSRMESNGDPGKTQISENANILLLKEYPMFSTELRGDIPIKVRRRWDITVSFQGKGLCKTYWLLGTHHESTGSYTAPMAKGSNGNFGTFLGNSQQQTTMPQFNQQKSPSASAK